MRLACGSILSMEITDVQWEVPPPPRGERVARFKELVPHLKANPGRWAVAETELTQYGTQAAVMANRINKGGYPIFRPEGEWEARSSKEGKVYVRWIGPNGAYREVRQDASVEWEAPPGMTGS